ncbi:CHAT domain-containing protein [Bacteroides sp. 519]|uniref:CHAT domain-containing protein n=1 Tax=Bacteroides sp. 519 TaxID=2302937 RepID=UPI0013D55B99|nr:CHAT domain-containing protein [Bacteroides sp. 519]NDV57267.1 CHAT domain-containing protein [Bacteroides sp. 519]
MIQVICFLIIFLPLSVCAQNAESDYVYPPKDSPLEHAKKLIREGTLSLNYNEKKEAENLFKEANKIRKEFPKHSIENVTLLFELYVSHKLTDRDEEAIQIFFEIQNILINEPDLRLEEELINALNQFDSVGESKLKKLLTNETLFDHARFLINESKSHAQHGEVMQAKKLLKRSDQFRKRFPRYSRENISLLWEPFLAYLDIERGDIAMRKAYKAWLRINKKPEIDLELAMKINRSFSAHLKDKDVLIEYNPGLEFAAKYFAQQRQHAYFLVKKCQEYMRITGSIPEDHIDYLKEAILIYEKEGLTNSSDWHTAMFLLGKACLDNFYFEDTILVLNSIPNPEVTLVDYQYVDYLACLIEAYMELENYSKAEEILAKTQQLETMSYELYSSIGNFYMTIGNYDAAEEHFEKIVGSKKEKQSDVKNIYALGKVYEQKNKTEQALKHYNKARKIQKKYLGKKDITYITITEKYLSLLNSTRPGHVREREITSLVKTIKTKYGTKSIAYATLLNQAGEYYYTKRKYQKAMLCFMEGWEIVNDIKLGKQHTVYKLLAQNIALAIGANNPEDAVPYFRLVLESVKENIFDGFTFLPADDKELFLNSRQSVFNTIKRFSFRNRDSKAVSELCYDVELFHKNLLLTSSTQTRDAILKSNNEELIKWWNEIKHLKEQIILNRVRGRIKEVDSLTTEMQLIEKELTRISGQYRIFKNEYNQSWQDVKNSLQQGEAAIEFAFAKSPGNQVNYYVLLIRPEYTSPKIISCCSEPDLQAALPDSVNRLYALIWQSLDNELQGVTDIYIASAGLLHHVPFAALKDTQGNCLIDKYNLHHVLSTREIKSANKGNLLKVEPPIALFGGMDYTQTNYTLEKLKQEKTHVALMRSLVDSLDMDRGQGFGDLRFSGMEVDSIAKLFTSKGWETNLYTKNEATESNFKALSSQSPPIIHVSTHGFYFRLAPDDENTYKASGNPLMRSGMVFSGVNRFWTSSELSDDATEDGVLTAYEISSLDLSGTQLIVLSACNTAKGDIMNNEGAYGLQRAFRLAGVKNMITTLWSVNDKEAQEFMVEFYKQWIPGSSLRGAFANTQRKFRKEPESKITKWAGFVLIE